MSSDIENLVLIPRILLPSLRYQTENFRNQTETFQSGGSNKRSLVFSEIVRPASTFWYELIRLEQVARHFRSL
jgi:hypothetical protein